MNSALVAARAGLSRGRIEFKQTLTTPGDLIAILITTGGFLAAMIWTRHTHVPGTHFSLGTTMLVSVLGLNVRPGAQLSHGSRGQPATALEEALTRRFGLEWVAGDDGHGF
jgi:ABC-2 type transport system permease protein